MLHVKSNKISNTIDDKIQIMETFADKIWELHTPLKFVFVVS